MLPFVLLGIIEVLRPPRTAAETLVLFGFLTAPLAAVLATTEQSVVIRATLLIPFGVLLGCYGLRSLAAVKGLSRPSWWLAAGGAAIALFGILYGANLFLAERRVSSSALALVLCGIALAALARSAGLFRQGPWLAGVLVAGMLMQFGVYWADYFGDYRIRLSPWLGGNLAGALEGLIDLDRRQAAPQIYMTVLRSTGGLMDTRNRWMDAYWRFYAGKHGREDLLGRTVQAFEVVDAPRAADGSLFLAFVDDHTVKELVERRILTVERVIPELGREPFFVILKK